MSPRAPDARRLALGVLVEVERAEARTAAALDRAFAGAPELGAAERGLATELVYGVLRQRGRLDRALAAHASGGAKGLRRAHPTALRALRVAAYQILCLDRVPAAAAVDAAVSAVREAREPRTAGFVNAVLRRLAAEGEPPLPDPARRPEAWLVEAASLPPWLAKRMLRWYPAAEAISLAEALLGRAPTVLRANPLRTTRGDLASALAARTPPVETLPCAHAPEGLRLTGSGDPRRLAPELHGAGNFTVQDEASQLVAHVVAPAAAEALLDACAGRGGKTLHLAGLAPTARLLPMDRQRSALRALRERARRLGLGPLTPLAADLSAPLPLGPDARFDAVLLDAPCSGLGVLRRHPEAKWRLRPEDLDDLATRQGLLLERAVERVRPGGRLIYAVCTFNPEEGPARIAALLERHPELAPEPPPPGAVDWAPLLGPDGASVTPRPDRHDTDGFYVIRLRRRP